MEKFSNFRFKRINEQEITLSTTTTTTTVEEQPVEKEEIKPVVVTITGATEQPSISTNQSSNPVNDQSTDQSSTEEPKENLNASKFFSKLFESREMAHVYHLQSNGNDGSFASHKSLETYYNEVLDLIDTIVEVYQGQYEIVENYEIIDTTDTKNKEKIAYFEELQKFIKDNRYVSLSKEDTHLQNVIDEIVSLAYRTLYKLKYMK